MSKRRTILAICLFLALVGLQMPARAPDSTGTAEEVPSVPHEYTLEIPCYVPTRLTVNYAYTHNHSISDISTVGASLYKHSGGPNFLEFIASDVDTYRFTVELRYEEPTNQTILIGVWSGSLPVQGISLFSVFQDVVIHVTLSMTKEPSYPSEMDVAKAVTAKIAKDLQDTYNAIQSAMERQNRAVTTNSMLSIVSLFGVITMAAVFYLEVRRLKGMRWATIKQGGD